MRTTCGQSQPGAAKAALSALGLAGWSKLRDAWQVALDKLAPLGYQDETGFHFGVEPATQSLGRYAG